ncbi:MAG: Uncharacterized protein G01um10143_86 [Parcubacteria group bacterium Gr01-1014_3]|nr:MAG: Uncharacterized protein G01um10143_86 [Parcubacteria group bacterium Gr01-1014_3]
MRNLREVLEDADRKNIAIGHFNISELGMLNAIAEVARELMVPVIIGTSEGEREFIDTREAAALVKTLREEHDQEIFLNADHTHSLDKIKEAVEAGYDAVLFDGGKLPMEENLRQTKEVVEYVRSRSEEIVVEGELGYIGSGSTIRKEIPKGAAIKPEDLTTPEEAAKFAEETSIDLLAPAVGNIHGMFANAPEPALDIDRTRAVRMAAKVPLVLHGGSGNTDADFLLAIDAGVRIIHISTELRAAWREGMEKSLKEKPEEIAPYKLMGPALDEMKKVVYNRLKLFNKLH